MSVSCTCVCECNRESESVKSVFVGECVPPRAQLWASIEGVCVCVCRVGDSSDEIPWREVGKLDRGKNTATSIMLK